MTEPDASGARAAGDDAAGNRASGAHEPDGKPSNGRPRRGIDRPLMAVLIVIAALVVVALIVVFARPAPERLDASTPEGTVQRYVTAVLDGDYDTAMEYLTAEVRDECEDTVPYADSSSRVSLGSSTIRDERADVTVTLEVAGGGGLFGGSTYQTEGTFGLVEETDGWRIDRAPWDLALCAQAAR